MGRAKFMLSGAAWKSHPLSLLKVMPGMLGSERLGYGPGLGIEIAKRAMLVTYSRKWSGDVY